MWWLNKDHRCRDRERKRTQSNDASGALQHMAHQSRVKPPHKLHALYIAICINKLPVFWSTSTNAWAEGPPHLQRNFIIIIIIIINVHFIYVHWPTPSDNGIFLRCTDKHSSAGSACLISFPSICNPLPGWDRASHEVKIFEFQKWALTVFFFCLCIYINAQSYVVSWWQWHCCLQKDLASSTFHTSTHITAPLSGLLTYLKNGRTTPTSADF